MRRLARSDIDALPEGTRILVSWAGPDDPREFVLARDVFGAPVAAMPPGSLAPGVWAGPLWRVGFGPFETHVWLPD